MIQHSWEDKLRQMTNKLLNTFYKGKYSITKTVPPKDVFTRAASKVISRQSHHVQMHLDRISIAFVARSDHRHWSIHIERA